MKKTQYISLNSVRNVLGVLTENAAKLTGMPALVAIVNQIQSKVGEIDTLTGEQERSRKGVTADKNHAREQLVRVLLVVCGQLQAWARQTNQLDVIERAPAVRSYWHRVPQGKLAERAGAVLELARASREKLRNFGLTDAVFTQLETAINTFHPMAGAPRGEIVRRITLTSKLRQEVRELSSLLSDVLDPLMFQFQATEPKFFTDYRNARAQVQLPATPVEVIRERAAAKAAKAEARKAAKAERIAAKAAAVSAAKALRQSRLAAITGSTASSANGNSDSANRSQVAVEQSSAALAS